MNNQETYEWLAKRGIELEEGFMQSLRDLAKTYQKENGIRKLDDVYKLIGVRKQYISYWKNNPSSTQTKKFQAQCHLCGC
ncbi:MAG: hypothetical protein LBQ50_13290 [Planctomycetaceae bacterium]|jgi:hypothetical protein|nr:hypothetical protein [Planctomycetaceae bacterium]